jgi:DNA ligase-1
MLYQTSAATGKTKVWNAMIVGETLVEESGPLDGPLTQKIIETKSTDPKGLEKELKSLRQKRVKQGYTETMEKPLGAMLANEWNHEPLVFPIYVQPKLDGIRCLVYEKDGQTVFQSRNHTVFQDFPHIRAIPGIVMDGELYHHDLEFHEITSIVRKKNHPRLSELQYHVYDLIADGTFEQRLSLLESLNLTLTETKKVHSVEAVEDYHRECVERGYEGIMLRTPGGKYRQTRSKDLLKYKHFKTDEYKVVGHTIGKEGIPVLECQAGDKTFGVMMKSTLEEKQKMMTNIQEFYGEWVTVKYQELSKDGIPRFPVGIAFRQKNGNDFI